MRGQRKFRNPVEGRYYSYSRPTDIVSVCERCNGRMNFHAASQPTHLYDEFSGGYRILRGEIGGTITGQGSCLACGHVSHKIQWPDAAYFKVTVREGIVWAWNESYLPALVARVAGDKVQLRRMIMADWNLARFISRLPKYAVLKKNRAKIIIGLRHFLSS